MRKLNHEQSTIWKLLKDFEDKFKARETHINRCANLIKTIKTWDSSSQDKNHNCTLDQDLLVSKNLFKRIIRVSGESADYRATVDFVSIQALDKINNNSKARKNPHAKFSKKLSKKDLETGIRHEHMYPCEAAFNELHKSKYNSHSELFVALNEYISFRALIYIEEEKIKKNGSQLGGDLKSMLPALKSTTKCDAPALSRYCKLELDKDLIPVSDRGVSLYKKKYVKFEEDDFDELSTRCKLCEFAGK